ncbi:sensor histidine kinase [Salinicoccus kekensis]|uniref:histidine kinase n=1 Tax=Salinicoccus kekensis TaxID=714307 RepID=A0A285UGT7_9STAP|nr:sensor histidine kinase [Salinicoccus kekensis]SOC40618.1 two-component system sensor histidine kinase DesK [Salinicoccus kekensis]
MRDWYHIFAKNTGLSLYIWIVFCVLPFYFIFRSTSSLEIVFGVVATALFFAVFWLTYNVEGPKIYIGLSIEFVINIIMTYLFGYVYFALFIAFYVGIIRNRAGFISMYVIHLVTTIAAMVVGFIGDYSLFISHLPFLIMTVLGVILIPIGKRSRIQTEELEDQLADANQKIAELAIADERNRIARDLHDTLGQKLSMIGLKSELSSKLIDIDTVKAKNELEDIHHTSRQALKEVRELIGNMRHNGLAEELERVGDILDTAGIDHEITVDAEIGKIPELSENILSMCLKEAVNNVIRHAGADYSFIELSESKRDLLLKVSDNGTRNKQFLNGNGLDGMRERLAFVSGEMHITQTPEGFEINVSVPKILKEREEG